MPKLVQILQNAAPAIDNIIPIFAEAEAIEALVIQMEPGAKALVLAEWAKVKDSVGTILTAAASFKAASIFGKATDAFSLLSAVLSVGSTLQAIYADGEKYFAAQWPSVKTHIDNILGMVTAPTPAAAAPVAVTGPSAPAASPVV